MTHRMQAEAQLQRMLAEVEGAMRRGDTSRATQLSEEAVQNGLQHPAFFTLAGHGRMRDGRNQAALQVLERARALSPQNPEVLNALGICLVNLGRPSEAVAAYDTALRNAPGFAVLHFNRGCALEEAGVLREAGQALERAVQIEPRYPEALARLAGLAVRRGDYDAARQWASRALAIAPLAAATLALAKVEIEAKNLDAARDLLAPLLSDPNTSAINRSLAFTLMGDALDGLNKIDEAFDAYVSARRIWRDEFGRVFEAEGVETAVAAAKRLADYFETVSAQDWRVPADEPGPTHVFLVGFPRSGTTLLEQVLASHSDIETLEEVDCLEDAVAAFIRPQNGPAALMNLRDGEVARYRALYWQRAAAAGATRMRRVFVDKMPLNTIHLCLVARLFPQAKILFALRDPRDVVLSCFRRRLATTRHMYEFSTLDRAASYYDAVMRLGQIYRDKLGLTTLDVRHEDMLGAFDDETRRICAFLGVEPDKAMGEFAGAARGRDIKTPSAAQIARGLSRDGAGQWRRYRRQLEPVMAILQPWTDRFGYSAG